MKYSAPTKGLSALLVPCSCEVNSQYNGVGDIFSLILQMQEGHIWFMAKLVESPSRPAWRQLLELLVVLITKSQGATQKRRRRCHVIFR